MGQRSNVDDFGYFNAGTMDGTDSRLAAVAGSFNISLNLAETEVEGNLSAILCCHLSCVGGILLRTAEALLNL